MSPFFIWGYFNTSLFYPSYFLSSTFRVVFTKAHCKTWKSKKYYWTNSGSTLPFYNLFFLLNNTILVCPINPPPARASVAAFRERAWEQPALLWVLCNLATAWSHTPHCSQCTASLPAFLDHNQIGVGYRIEHGEAMCKSRKAVVAQPPSTNRSLWLCNNNPAVICSKTNSSWLPRTNVAQHYNIVEHGHEWSQRGIFVINSTFLSTMFAYWTWPWLATPPVRKMSIIIIIALVTLLAFLYNYCFSLCGQRVELYLFQ